MKSINQSSLQNHQPKCKISQNLMSVKKVFILCMTGFRLHVILKDCHSNIYWMNHLKESENCYFRNKVVWVIYRYFSFSAFRDNTSLYSG